VILDSAGSATALVLALALGAVGLLIMPRRPRVWSSGSAAIVPSRGGGSGAVRRAVVGAMAVGAAGVLLAPNLWWVVLPVAGVTGVLLARRPAGVTGAQRAERRKVIVVSAELLAACLDAGMAVGPALRAVTDVLSSPTPGSSAAPGSSAVPGSAAARLSVGVASINTPDPGGPLAVFDAVAAMLALGAAPTTAWQPADLDEDLAPLAAAARRSAAGGGGLAQAVREHAGQLRADAAAASVRAAGRAGVLMTAPLGICFLPAFLCLGLAPVVVGLLGQLEIF
jgi:hypothetical protein